MLWMLCGAATPCVLRTKIQSQVQSHCRSWTCTKLPDRYRPLKSFKALKTMSSFKIFKAKISRSAFLNFQRLKTASTSQGSSWSCQASGLRVTNGTNLTQLVWQVVQRISEGSRDAQQMLSGFSTARNGIYMMLYMSVLSVLLDIILTTDTHHKIHRISRSEILSCCTLRFEVRATWRKPVFSGQRSKEVWISGKIGCQLGLGKFDKTRVLKNQPEMTVMNWPN